MFEKEAVEYAWKHTFYDEYRERERYDKPITEIFKDSAEFGYNKGKNEAKEIIKDQQELLDRVLSGAETLSDFAQNTLRKAEQFLKDSEVEE